MNIILPIVPQPWRRTRGQGKARFTDPKTRAYKNQIALLVKSHMRGKGPGKGAFSLHLEFYMPVPKSWSKKKKANLPDHVSTPDLDNLVKAIKDALNGVVWVDDSQITYLAAKKHYSDNPRIKIFTAIKDG